MRCVVMVCVSLGGLLFRRGCWLRGLIVRVYGRVWPVERLPPRKPVRCFAVVQLGEFEVVEYPARCGVRHGELSLRLRDKLRATTTVVADHVKAPIVFR